MSAKWIVLKFGGTSVASRPNWEAIASLARDRQDEGFRVLLVCSAVAGVTDCLNELADRPAGHAGLNEILDLHRALGRELGVQEGDWLPQGRALLEECVEALRQESAPAARAALLAMGEWFSTRLGACFIRQQELDVAWVDAREALEISPEPELSPARQWLSADCDARADRALTASWSGVGGLLVTQGFVARSPDGRTALLGRGGSDTSAALLAGRLEAERLEIWTDVPGLFSADPRLCADARLLAGVDYAEALEMAASGARVIHPRSIRAAAETGTPIVIGDMHRPDIAGTRIGAAEVSGEVEIDGVAEPLRFRADRMDRTTGGLDLLDYKTSRPPITAVSESTRRKNMCTNVAHGRLLQGVAYALAADGGWGRYLYLAPEIGGKPESVRSIAVW